MATLKTMTCRMAIAVAIGSIVPALASAADAARGQVTSPALQCRASIGTTDIAWTVELDHAVPLAIVDSEDTPAQYTGGHVSIRLAMSGPTLFIGLHSGRLLVTAADGTTLGSGMCKPLMTATTGSRIPVASLSVPATLFQLSAA